MTDGGAPFRILTVCTGNICRSPAAERLLGEALDDSVEVTSAGTEAVVGHPIDANMVWLMERDGHRTGSFAARQVSEELVRSADLVLPLTRAHRAVVVDLAPAAVRRTFTLTEFAAILGAVTVDEEPTASAATRLRALLPRAVAARPSVRLAPNDLDIPDPFGGSAEDYAHAYDAVSAAVDAIARVVGVGRRGVGGPR